MEEIPIFDVSGVVAVLNQTLEYALPIVTVVGELDSFKVAKSKWIYADLKDDYAKIRLFGTVYMLPGPLEDGMLVEVTGQPRIHPLYGFSLNIQSIKPVGEGSIKKAAHLLAQKLEAEGLFDESRKRSVPYPPERVGLVTSVESAAYADFIKILEARWQGVDIEVYDSQVQGDAAIETIVAGIQYFNQSHTPPDVLVLIRGGGSIDDLSVFSTEPVVRAVAASRVPTCVAIGHEIDVSLAELAADLRASTPSNAAELLFPDRREVSIRYRFKRERLEEMLQARIDTRLLDIKALKTELVTMVESVIDRKLQSIDHARTVFEAVHPKATLRRGFALVQSDSGKLISSHAQLAVGDDLRLTFSDGTAEARIEKL